MKNGPGGRSGWECSEVSVARLSEQQGKQRAGLEGLEGGRRSAGEDLGFCLNVTGGTGDLKKQGHDINLVLRKINPETAQT